MKPIFYLKAVWLTILGLLISFVLIAQTRDEIDVQHWAKGIVTLTTGKVLEGVVTYYRTQDIITVRLDDSTLSTLSPVNVEQFEVTDVSNSRNHLFRSIFWDQGNEYTDFKKPTFFEQVLQGKITLLMRESYYKRANDPYMAETMSGRSYDPSGYPIDNQFADQIKPRFFVMTSDGEIIKLQRVRKDFLNYCGQKASAVKAYAKKQKLSFELPQDFITIVNYYNTL